jgi:hypothetical protein
MPGYVIERHGYTTAAAMVGDVVTDMIANGFNFIWTTGGGTTFNKATAGDVYRVILEAGGDVDPLNADNVVSKQPWRVCFDVQDAQRAFVHVATPLQLTNEGIVATEKYYNESGSTSMLQSIDYLGSIGAQVGAIYSTSGSSRPGIIDPTSGLYQAPTASGGVPGDETTKGLIMRKVRVAGFGASYPLSYRLAITNRGFWLGCWEAALTAESSSSFNWMLVQRPVDRTTGAVLTTGKAPVFCVSGVGGQYWQFTVRESDILRPGKRRSASENTEDSEAILNIEDQVSLSEDGKYIVTFPSRLNTSRYRYPHELDMIGITSADVVSQYSDVPLTVYGEGTPRSYKALHANGVNNTGMRILVLQQGGGIS